MWAMNVRVINRSRVVEACNRSITCIHELSRQHRMIVKDETRHDTPIDWSASSNVRYILNKDNLWYK